MLFFRRRRKGKEDSRTKGVSERGILVFHHTSDVIRAETLLRQAGMEIQVKGPPPELRTGCDLVIEFPLVQELQARELLEREGVSPIQVAPVQDLLLEPVSLCHTKDFGRYFMVRAANMKITVDKQDLTIVNVSGGGCPDVPFLAETLVGQRLDRCREPRHLGQTLCGYALQLAYEEMLRQCRG
ncbi:MAG: DUF3343 domain-containing protein [Desulfovibrionales bacterium]